LLILTQIPFTLLADGLVC